jgi:hypothetical protein
MAKRVGARWLGNACLPHRLSPPSATRIHEDGACALSPVTLSMQWLVAENTHCHPHSLLALGICDRAHLEGRLGLECPVNWSVCCYRFQHDYLLSGYPHIVAPVFLELFFGGCTRFPSYTAVHRSIGLNDWNFWNVWNSVIIPPNPAKTIGVARDRNKSRRWRRGGFRRNSSRAESPCSTSRRKRCKGRKAYRRYRICVRG